jgi:hypothetical protein
MVYVPVTVPISKPRLTTFESPLEFTTPLIKADVEVTVGAAVIDTVAKTDGEAEGLGEVVGVGVGVGVGVAVGVGVEALAALVTNTYTSTSIVITEKNLFFRVMNSFYY